MTNQRTQSPPINANNADSITQIRDIILGDYFSSLDRKFKLLEQRLIEFEKNTEHKTRVLNEKIDSMQNSQKNSIEVLSTELNQVKNEIRSILKKFRDELDANINKLAQHKMDKSAIGEIFIQLGHQLKEKSGSP
ncbi:MAG: hypothetical protein ACE5HO_21065 [bacterium]